EKARKAKLRLDVFEGATRPAKGGVVAIVPNKPEASELIKRVSSTDEDEMMPPPKASTKPLTAAQVEVLRRWIADGAQYKRHWAYVKPVWRATPAVRASSWCAHAIGPYVPARPGWEGLGSSQGAHRHALNRRSDPAANVR